MIPRFRYNEATKFEITRGGKMLKFELQKAADKLINEIFAVKKGETVVITADTMSDEGLVDAVAASVYSVGGFPMVITIVTPGGVGKSG